LTPPINQRSTRWPTFIEVSSKMLDVR
jgi:hypothetical protein